MVQQLCASAQSKWESKVMHRSSTTKSSTNKTGTQEPTLNDILPKPNNVKYLSLIDGSSGYHNLKLDERSSYLLMFVCHLVGTGTKWLPSGAEPAGDMFQRKIDEILKTIAQCIQYCW